MLLFMCFFYDFFDIIHRGNSFTFLKQLAYQTILCPFTSLCFRCIGYECQDAMVPGNLVRFCHDFLCGVSGKNAVQG